MDPQPYLRILQLIDTKVSGGGREGEGEEGARRKWRRLISYLHVYMNFYFYLVS